MSRYDLFRKRLAPIAFGLAIVLLARDACNKEHRTHATIVFDVGAANKVDDLKADLTIRDVYVANFHHGAFSGTVQYDVSLPSDEDGELHIELDARGKLQRTVRHFHAEENGVITVPLADLATP